VSAHFEVGSFTIIGLATHPEGLDQVAAADGWDAVMAASLGSRMALRQAAASVSLDFQRW
jgi:hypothetical protein